ncbi:MAG: glutamine--fructose-6-phosphate transaminase (isomerizing) [Burkholderiaceae bacterium]|nr:glutamine--fructose-6-phosphate transaminase (isomerizing) [Burkholderiaceae bacterium]
MCGIVGAVAKTNIVDTLIEGLRRLEYRGYDSCGFAVIDSQQGSHPIRRARTTDRVADLAKQAQDFCGQVGIAHTRWATHGRPDTHNAHPHISNGQIAVTQATKQLKGAYAIAVIAQAEPHLMVGARAGSPLIIAIGDDGHYLSSDALALAGKAKTMVYLEEGDLVTLTVNGFTVWDQVGQAIEREVKPMPVQAQAVELGPYQHFMQKEIFEQARAVSDTIANIDELSPALFAADSKEWQEFDQVLILACGTSYYSACVAKYWFEDIAKIPTQVEIASEYRYRQSIPNPRSLIVVVSQSGETADTLAALRHAKQLGHPLSLSICNVASSAMVRETKWHFLTHAGTEVGVASTKAFTTQLVALYLLANTIAKRSKHLSLPAEKKVLEDLRHLPQAIHAVLALEPQIIAWSRSFANCQNALFLGRGLHFPIALEGALKLKEISYIHAEAYPAGELKHGPLALVTEAMPVVTVAPNDVLLEKLKSNMQEVKARGGRLYVFADQGTEIKSEDGIQVIRLPEHYGNLSPLLHVIPLQLLAYHTAVALGTDVDKPRNLAKSVTVE